MLENIIRSIKKEVPLVWNIIEIINGNLNKYFLFRELNKIRSYINNYSEANGIYFRYIKRNDIDKLHCYLNNIPKEDLKYFKPFPFDYVSITKVLCRNNFLLFFAISGTEVVGVFFLRVIFIKKAYLGFIVSRSMRGRGIGKNMIKALKCACQEQNIELFSTVSRDNISSLKAHIANNFIEKATISENYVILEIKRN